MTLTALKRFALDDDGAVTIDWVALTASLLVLGIAVVYFIYENGVPGALDSINGELSRIQAQSPPSAPSWAQ
ncbi:MAG: hypothetical protein AAFR79_07245 [Pseudomonadota bacterium]